MARWVVLNQGEMNALMQRVNGQGGIQTFIRRLQGKLRPATGEIRLDDKDLENIPHYAFDYGQGGFEQRIIDAFKRELGELLGREEQAGENGPWGT
jgi:ABC-type hemin transport system ATPase subunit